MDSLIILDGGMGRELQKRGAPFKQPEWSALALMKEPLSVQAVHEDFITSGAEVIITNNYAVVPFHLGKERFERLGYSLSAFSGELAKDAVRATKSKTQKKVKVAGSIPPLFGSYRADLFDAEKAPQIAKTIIDGLDPYIDCWLFETVSCIAEATTLLPLLPQDGRPCWVSFTLIDEEVTDKPRLRSGELVADAIQKILPMDVSAILFNCSQPEVITDAIQVTKQILDKHQAKIRIGAYANGFLPMKKDAQANSDVSEIRKDLDETQYLEFAKQWRQLGASIIGGCCGIGPEYIKVLSTELE